MRVRYVSFSESFAYALNEWSLDLPILKDQTILIVYYVNISPFYLIAHADNHPCVILVQSGHIICFLTGEAVEVFCKKRGLKNFGKKRDSGAGVFMWILEISKNNFYYRTLPVAVSVTGITYNIA